MIEIILIPFGIYSFVQFLIWFLPKYYSWMLDNLSLAPPRKRL
jgi:hypothetical protein